MLENNDQSIKLLFDELESDDSQARGRAAYRPSELAEAAVEALFRGIASPADRDHRGSLLYALRELNCSNRFSELFHLALNGDYEVQRRALMILESHFFRITHKEFQDSMNALFEPRPRKNLTDRDLESLREKLISVISRVAISQNKDK